MGNLYRSFINSKDMGTMIDVGGPTVHYIDDGSGPPILFLHGLGFSMFTFRNNFFHFVQNMRMIAADLPGCGYSRLPGNYGGSPAEMAKYLKSLLDLLHVKQAVLCGVGEGGVYALELACRYPEMVSALVLVSPGSLTRHFPPYVRQLLNPVFGELRINAMGPQHIYQLLQWCYFNEISVDNYLVKQVYRPFENRMARHVLLKLLKEYDDCFIHENLGNVKCPTLIVWGEGDAGRPCGMAEMYGKAIPNATVHIIRNAGILPHEEKSIEFNDVVSAFLATVIPELKRTPEPDMNEDEYHDESVDDYEE
jgi:pimeloyl-ACP methyl ester carboxylesterase